MSILAIVVLSAGGYLQWGVFSVSVTNLAVILAMIVVFVLALLIPFPKHDGPDGSR